MLANGAPSSFAEGARCLAKGHRLLLLAAGRSSPFPVFPSNSSSSSHSNVGSGCSKGRLAARSQSYRRIPMDTAGAYQVVDEETGEKFIVWGGADDGLDSPVPSKDVLNWKPAAANADNLGPNGGPRRRAVGVVGSFGKLKAQKVNALIRSKKSPAAEFDDDDDDEEIDYDDDYTATSSDAGSKFEMKNRNEVFRRRREHAPQIGSDFDQDDEDEDEDGVAPDAHYKSNVKKTGNSRFLGVLQKEKRVNGANNEDPSSPTRGWRNVDPPNVWKPDVKPDNRPQKKNRKLSGEDGRFFSRKSFKELGCNDEMVECLGRQQFHRPSHIQAMTYRHLLDGKSCIISDQSGSGKTLAYLAPTIQRLRQEELEGISKSLSKSPRVLILVPTAELATQVLINGRSIARSGVPFRSMVATGGFRQKTQLESLEQDLDILIATPGRFIYLLREGFLKLSNLRCAVLDEVDILFGDETFEQCLRTLISSAPVMMQYLFITATLPSDIYNKLVEEFPDCMVITGPGAHRTSYGLEEILVDCSGKDGEEKNPETAFSNKKSALLQLVEQSPVPKTVIFCNKIDACRKVENVLKRFDRKEQRIKILPFHGALDQESRLSNMKEFMTSRSDASLFLICTDRASRGIDFVGVDHVVLFDFPRDPSEYIRRVGRTARGAGGKGKAFAFVLGKQVSLAQKIFERNQKGHPLHDIPSC
ncbi:DEA(D/H)-box RNA helicase family protein [Wolffia australiana]